MRFLPMGKGLSPVEALLRERGAGSLAIPGNWEFGRLVLDPCYRGGPEMLQRCVFLAVSELARKFRCGQAFASCTPVLSRLYRRFGFSVLASDVRVPGEEKPYHLIQAAVPDVLMAAASTDAERTLARSLLTA
ncbi:MAG TPA: N-acetyltransferase [Ramlibacter sp.]|nr:N-acetyltransferase [Ramlibacter sp.]